MTTDDGPTGRGAGGAGLASPRSEHGGSCMLSTSRGPDALRALASGQRIHTLLRDDPTYRRQWERHAVHHRGSAVHQGAVALVLAQHLWDTGQAPDSDRQLPRRLKDLVSRALSGRVLSARTLELFIDAFTMGPHAAELRGLRSGLPSSSEPTTLPTAHLVAGSTLRSTMGGTEVTLGSGAATVVGSAADTLGAHLADGIAATGTEGGPRRAATGRAGGLHPGAPRSVGNGRNPGMLTGGSMGGGSANGGSVNGGSVNGGSVGGGSIGGGTPAAARGGVPTGTRSGLPPVSRPGTAGPHGLRPAVPGSAAPHPSGSGPVIGRARPVGAGGPVVRPGTVPPPGIRRPGVPGSTGRPASGRPTSGRPAAGGTPERVAPGYKTLALHELHELGPDGSPRRHRTVHVIRAVHPLSHYLLRINADRARVQMLRGGTVGPVHQRGQQAAAWIELATPLRPGETVSLEYVTWMAYDRTPPLAFRRAAVQPLENLEVHVKFHPERLPEEIRWAVWPLPGGTPTHQETVPLGPDGSVHRFVPNVQGAVVGFRWRFGTQDEG